MAEERYIESGGTDIIQDDGSGPSFSTTEERLSAQKESLGTSSFADTTKENIDAVAKSRTEGLQTSDDVFSEAIDSGGRKTSRRGSFFSKQFGGGDKGQRSGKAGKGARADHLGPDSNSAKGLAEETFENPSKSGRGGSSGRSGRAGKGAVGSAAAKQGLKTSAENLRGKLTEDDDGWVDTANQAYTKAKRTRRGAMEGYRLASKGAGMGSRAAQVARSVVATVKSVATKVFSNPAVLKVLAIALVVLVLVGAILGIAQGIISAVSASSQTITADLPLSAEVEALRPAILKEAAAQGIPEYTDLLLAVVMQESGGRAEDCFQASESMGKPPNSIDRATSIKQGVSVIKARLHSSKVADPSDIEHIRLALQGYNFGGAFIPFAIKNYGGWTQDAAFAYAEKYSNGVRNTGARVDQLGPWRYGDQYYTDHVLRYYSYSISVGASGPVPAYLQGDPRWASTPYLTGTIKSNGCGLTSAAMAFEALSGQKTTPLMLRNAVGNSCGIGGLNDMNKFCAYGKKTYGLKHSGPYSGLDNALSEVKKGRLVFVSVKGTIKSYTTAGHIMLIYDYDEKTGKIFIRDPASSSNSLNPFTKSDMSKFTQKYFYSIYK